MTKMLRQYSISLAAVLLCVLMSWGMPLRPAEGYAPIDDLIASVDRLYQAGQVTIRANLIVGLQSIGSLIDGGIRSPRKSC